jgi:hypothetical protein
MNINITNTSFIKISHKEHKTTTVLLSKEVERAEVEEAEAEEA